MKKGADFFIESAAVYDHIYEQKNTVSEVEWVVSQMMKNGLSPGGRILEFGSGTGRHATLLGEEGFSVTGIEPSIHMIDKAPEHPNTTFVHGDARTIRLQSTFDAVLALFHVLSYQIELKDTTSFIETAAVHLKPGGIFGFDVWFSPAVSAIGPEIRVLELETEELSIRRQATPTEDILRSLVEVDYSYSVLDRRTGVSSAFNETHPMRHFSYTEIFLLAQANGFEIVETSEFLTGRAASRETWGVWFVLRRV